MHLPAAIGEFTDFFAGIHHARNGGIRRDPNNPLNPNYKYRPGRLSQPRLLGAAVGCADPPAVRPAQGAGRGRADLWSLPKLDYELELAVWIGPGNALGEPIPIERAADHIFGLGLLNDWSARDIQQWESQPLGPFLGKNFGRPSRRGS